jgi:glycine cleavage system H protein
MHPDELKYSPQNIWSKIENDGLLRLGITHYYQGQLHNIVFLELQSAGSQVTLGEPFGTIESSKTSVDLISPISGKVIEVNQAVLGKPGLINKEPYGLGWMVLVKPDKPEEIQTLLSSREYLYLKSGQA